MYYSRCPSCWIIIDCMKLFQPVHFQPFLILLFLNYGNNEDLHLDFPSWFSEWFFFFFFFLPVFSVILTGFMWQFPELSTCVHFLPFRVKWLNWSQHSISYWPCWWIFLVASRCSFLVILVFCLARSLFSFQLNTMSFPFFKQIGHSPCASHLLPV